MDEPHLLAAARYIELDPVREGIVVAPSNYPGSSVRAHLNGKDDGLVKVALLLATARDWRRLLTSAAKEEEIERFRRHERTGRVLGDEDLQKRLEENLGRVLRRQKPGPRRAATR